MWVLGERDAPCAMGATVLAVAIVGVADDIAALAEAFAADPAAGQDLRAFLDDATAAAADGDAVALAAARAGIWTTMLRGAYAEAILAAGDGVGTPGWGGPWSRRGGQPGRGPAMSALSRLTFLAYPIF